MAPTITVADGEASGITASSTVAENTGDIVPGAAGAILGIVTLADPDGDAPPASDVKITGENGEEDGRFQVIDHMGATWLTLKSGQSLDFESLAGEANDDGHKEITLTLTVTDSGTPPEDGKAEVTIKVTNENDNPPSITVADGEASGITASSTVAENTGDIVPGAAGAILGIVTLADPDGDAPPASDVKITGENGEEDGRFQVIDHMGATWLTLKSGESLDYEEENKDGDPTIALTLMVTDAGGLTATAAATITVNNVNEAPVADADEKIDDATFVSGEDGEIKVDLKALFSDPDGDGLTYELSDDKPEWLELSVTTKGDDITGTVSVSGTETDDADDLVVEGVSIVASDRPSGGLSAEASFDVVLDKENDAPTRLELLVEDDDGVVERVSSVEVDENVEGEVLGRLRVIDKDDARHPHGQHEFSFESGGKKDDRFEARQDAEGGWWLALKADKKLDFEKYEDGEFVLEVTATDNKGAEDEDARESVSAEITIEVGDEGDSPTAGKLGDWWVTVDEDLKAEDVQAGDWLSFRLDTTRDDAAFKDADEGAKLTYSVRVADDDGAVGWLEIDKDSGKMTNKAGTLPKRGVYTVTVTATDEDGNKEDAEFDLAVALSDEPGATGDADGNDGPDIVDRDDFDYTEGSGGQKVASFSVDDDDIAIAPHPYGVLLVEFSATQEGQSAGGATSRLKLVPKGSDGGAAHYEIWTKSADELAVGDDGKKLKAADVPDPLDFEDGDEVEITIRVWDNFRYQEKDGKPESKPRVFDSNDDLVPVAAGNAADTNDITFKIVDAADSAPEFTNYQAIRIDGAAAGSDATRAPDPKSEDGTTTVKVDQGAETVIVVPLEAAWKDGDTDSDELTFRLNGRSDLPDWITVYGPDQWEDIQARSSSSGTVAVEGSDGPGIGDRDLAVAIVIDHSEAEGDDRKPGEGLASFTLTARDRDGNAATETISIDIKDINVSAPDDFVTIGGDPDGTGSLTMEFDLNDDPDFAAGGEPVLVLYTWSHDAGTPADTDDVIISASTSPHPLPLLEVDAQGRPTPSGGPFTRDYAGQTVTATVQYFERNPDGTIEVVTRDKEEAVAADSPTNPVSVPDTSTEDPEVNFHITTATTGLSVIIGATGQARAAAGSARLEFSKDGTSWDRETTPAAGNADATSGVTSAITLAVNANRDANPGDGAADGDARYYRVVYTYNDENNRPMEVRSDPVGKLGFLAATIGTTSTGGGDPTGGNATLGNATIVGRTIQADTQGNPADVQWQMWEDANDDNAVQANEWVDIAGNPDDSLTITYAHAGSQLRAKVTYMHEDNPATTDANENGWIRWIETTTPLPGPAAQSNVLPVRTQPTEEIRVNITQTADAMDKKTSEDGSGTGSVARKFLDSNGDDLTYTLVADDDGASPSDFIAVVAGGTTGLRPGNTVYVSGDLDSGATGDQTQTLAIDSDGNITYYTNSVTAHDATSTDGTGNTLVFDVNANDGTGDSAEDVTVTVRINVSPTAIEVGASPLGETEAAATTIAPTATINETASTTTAQVTSVGVLASLDVQDLNLVTDDYGTHDVTVLTKKGEKFVEDARFEVTPTGGGRTDSDNNGSTWEIRLKEGQEFDFESKDNPMGVVTFQVTATDGGEHSVDAYFKMTLIDNVAPTPAPPVAGSGNNNPGDPQYEKSSGGSGSSDPDLENPEGTDGLRDDDTDESDDDDFNSEDGPAIERPKDGGAFIDEDDLIGLAINDDLLGDFVLAIDDGLDIA